MMQEFIDLFGVLATGVIAVATIVLVYVTWNLARVSKREPFVVCFMESSLSSVLALHFIVKNTGNATAFDIKVNITPALPIEGVQCDDGTETNRKISVLPPEHNLLSGAFQIKEFPIKEFNVTVSWATKPNGKQQKPITYTIGHIDDFRRGWKEDGLHEINTQLKEFKRHFEKTARYLEKIEKHLEPPKDE